MLEEIENLIVKEDDLYYVNNGGVRIWDTSEIIMKLYLSDVLFQICERILLKGRKENIENDSSTIDYRHKLLKEIKENSNLSKEIIGGDNPSILFVDKIKNVVRYNLQLQFDYTPSKVEELNQCSINVCYYPRNIMTRNDLYKLVPEVWCSESKYFSYTRNSNMDEATLCYEDLNVAYRITLKTFFPNEGDYSIHRDNYPNKGWAIFTCEYSADYYRGRHDDYYWIFAYKYGRDDRYTNKKNEIRIIEKTIDRIPS